MKNKRLTDMQTLQNMILGQIKKPSKRAFDDTTIHDKGKVQLAMQASLRDYYSNIF